MSKNDKPPFDGKKYIEVPFEQAPPPGKKQTPAQKPPAEDEDDAFEPYRGKDNIEDDDLFGMNAEFEVEEEDEPSREELQRLARNVLPDTPETRLALEIAEPLERIGMMSAYVLAEEFAGKVPQDRLDRMIAATLLVGANNLDDIMHEFSIDTIFVVNEFLGMNLMEHEEDRIGAIRSFSRDARDIFLSGLIGDVELAAQSFKTDFFMEYPKEELKDLSRFIIAAVSRADMNARLTERCVDAFNDLCQAAGHEKLRLEIAQDGEIRETAQERTPAFRRRPPKPGM